MTWFSGLEIFLMKIITIFLCPKLGSGITRALKKKILKIANQLILRYMVPNSVLSWLIIFQ
jgi:hypothetical protein